VNETGGKARRRYTWETLPPDVNRLVNTHGKKEIIIHEELGRQEIIEEYVEV
jgi:hypothetical protein